MPFFRFHFVEASRLAEVSGKMADRIQTVVECPREHIVLEVIHSVIVCDGEVKGEEWPLVEVDYFERPRKVQDAVAKIVSECLAEVGYIHSDVHFRYLSPENYYENGVSFS